MKRESPQFVDAYVEAVRDDAKERKRAGNAKGGKSSQRIDATSSDNAKRTDAHRAKLAGTNRQYINDADRLSMANIPRALSSDSRELE